MRDIDDAENVEREKRNDKDKEIRVLQRALRGELGLMQIDAALLHIVETEAWRDHGFASFAEFAVASIKKHGLGVDKQAAADNLRLYLLRNYLYVFWGEVMEVIMRPRGRQPTNAVNDEDKPKRFYEAPTATTDCDTIINKLRSNYPDKLAEAGERKIRLLRIAREVGIIPKRELLCGILDPNRFKKLTPMEKANLLSWVFHHSPVQAQCGLFRRRVDKRLKEPFSHRWRELTTGQSQLETDDQPIEGTSEQGLGTKDSSSDN